MATHNGTYALEVADILSALVEEDEDRYYIALSPRPTEGKKAASASSRALGRRRAVQSIRQSYVMRHDI